MFVYSGTGSFIVDVASGIATPFNFVQGYGPPVWMGYSLASVNRGHILQFAVGGDEQPVSGRVGDIQPELPIRKTQK
ncbi:MAG: hypothetical protein NVSMB2_07430 [Chloroflexota bacterium]